MSSATHASDVHFPSKAGEYVKIGVVLFVLTALEVLGYEIAHRPDWPMHALMQSWLVPVLIVLSALKFALVAAYYMHLKWDGPLLKGIFSFSLLIAAVVILALMVLFIYHYAFAETLGKVG